VINAIKFSIKEIEASDQYFDHTRYCWYSDPKSASRHRKSRHGRLGSAYPGI